MNYVIGLSERSQHPRSFKGDGYKEYKGLFFLKANWRREDILKIAMQAIVKGHVQGVGFRYHTAHEALKRGLSGYAQNEQDGTVTVLILGEACAVNLLIEWLYEGPSTANVTEVTAEAVTWQEITGFAIQ